MKTAVSIAITYEDGSVEVIDAKNGGSTTYTMPEVKAVEEEAVVAEPIDVQDNATPEVEVQAPSEEATAPESPVDTTAESA